MHNDIDKIRTSAANGLTKAETEALLGHQMTDDELTQFNKTKAAIKLKAAADKKKEEQKALVAPTQGVTNGLKPKLPPVKERYTKEQVEDCIERHLGIVTSICNDLDCTYSQFYRAIKEYQLDGKIAEARKSIVAEAEGALLQALRSPDDRLRLDAAKYTLSRLGKEAGWGDYPMAVAVEISNDEKAKAIRAIFGIQGPKDE